MDGGSMNACAAREGAHQGVQHRSLGGRDPLVHTLPPSRLPQEKLYSLDLGKIRSGEDKRTTLMVKNIPNKYTQKMLLAVRAAGRDGLRFGGRG